MKVARAYGTRPEIFIRVSWDCLIRLSSPSMSTTARLDIEARIIAGERIVASDIDRARLTHAKPDRSALRHVTCSVKNMNHGATC